MVGHFKERIADAFEHVEPWFISSVAFDPKKCQVDIHIDVRKTTDIVCPYYRRATPYYVYEPHRNLIASIENTHSNNVISRFDYTNDEIGRRIARVDSGEAFSETAFERYAYNDRSEVIGSQRFYGSDITDLSHPVTGRSFGYGYDPIGNRTSSFEDVGGERLTTTYTANELNQYTAIQNASAVPLRGDAKREAVVTVNGDRAERDNGTASFTPWSYALPSSNSNASFQHADILAVAQSAEDEDVEQRESGSVFVPAAETLPTYDDDGNMTFDGRFRYSWNGENRMIRAEEAVAPTNRAPTVIAYAYDEQGRMVSKNIAGTNTVARSLLWDGYNIVREVENGTPTYNVWGLDLDGTVQGCGGVGGLLAVAKTNGLHVALYDANGNVSEYVAASGALSVHYEYSPFGEPLATLGESFAHQFSTKPYCSQTRLLIYQYRSVAVENGRWTSRDPVAESGGHNLFSFCGNKVLNLVNILGNEFFPVNENNFYDSLSFDDAPRYGYLWGFKFDGITDIPSAFGKEINQDFGPVLDFASDALSDIYDGMLSVGAAIGDGLMSVGAAVGDATAFAWRLPTEVVATPIIWLDYLFGAEKWNLTLCLGNGEIRNVNVYVGGIAARHWAFTPSASTICVGSGVLEQVKGRLDLGLSDPTILDHLKHEGGHTIQARKLGPFYLPLVVPFTGWSYSYRYFNWAEDWATSEGHDLSYPDAKKP